MAALTTYIAETARGAWSLAAGMAVTMRYMLKPVKTVQYPRRRMDLPEAYRGHIELVRSPETGGHLCVACGECFRTCPSKVIKVRGEKRLASEPTEARFFYIDYARCSFCGLCVEVCPKGALRFSAEYERAGGSRHLAVVDLMAGIERGGAA